MVKSVYLTPLTRVNPEYPDAAKATAPRRVDCVMRLTVGVTGEVTKVETVECDPAFIEVTRAALAQWIFVPFIYRKGEAPRAVRTDVTVKYKLR